MSEERGSRRTGVINSLLGLLINTCFLLFISLFVSVIVEWCGLYFNWWGGGSLHSLDMLRSELVYANSEIESAIIGDYNSDWISYFVEKYKSIMHTFFTWCSQGFSFINVNSSDIATYTDSGYNIAQVFILRLLLIIFSFPLFFMVFIWGLVDGLVERDLRKFGAGRESSTIFEAARKLSFPLLVLPFVIYLSYPVTINPLYIIPPSAIFQAFLYRMLFSKYKKYL